MGRTQSIASVILATVSLCATTARAATENVLFYNTAGGTANYGPETQITNKIASNQRILVYQGTVNINEGAVIYAGGNSAGTCNFIGIDMDSAANMNINGGTVWCTTAGGGAGYLGVGSSNHGVTSTLTLNAGILKVDTQLRSSTAYNGLTGCTSSGTVTINGGEATVKQIVLGASSSSTGTSTLILQGGVTTVEEINFQPYNGQVFNWANGTLVAARANVFSVAAYAGSKTRTMQIVNGAIASFDTAGYAQTIPAFTGTGKLRLAGGGAVTFEQSTLTYSLILDGVTLNLGALDSGATRLTAPDFEIVGPTTLNVTLPESPTGRYPLLTRTSRLFVSLGHLTVVGGGEGVLVRDANTIYLSFDPADADAALVYSDTAGGADTPERTAYTRLAFAETAGSFTVGGTALTNAYDIADQSAAPQVITAPVALTNATTSIYVAEGGRLEFAGGLTATTPMKEGRGTVVFSGTPVPDGLKPKEGTLDFGGNTLSGAVNFDIRRYHGEEIVLTNGTWSPSAATEIVFQGSTITLADGFTADFSAKANSRIAIGYAGVTTDKSVVSKLVIDGGSLTTADNGSNKGNFVGVDYRGPAVLEVRRGTFHAAGGSGRGYLRIAINDDPYLTGLVRVSGGLFKIDRDLSIATSYSGLNGGKGKGTFELSGGVADVENFYLGATSSNTGRGEVSLTGGVLEVGCLKSLAYNTQTLLADGGTIRAKRADTAAAPFMAKVASADSYAKRYTIGAGGLVIDTAGYDVHCDIPWTGEGGLTIMGDGGSLALCAPPAFTGDVVISNGTALVVTNSATFAGTVSLLGADSKIRIDTTSYTEDSMTIATDGFTLPSGVTDVLDLVELVGDGYVASVSADGKSIELGLAANVAAFAWWTGGGDPADLDDPANWSCTNSTGAFVENALPVKSTVVVLNGSNTFAIPAGTTPVWATTQVGDGGAVALAEDCDWSAYPGLTIADGSYIDLNGHSLKVAYLTAAEGYDGAYVTNSVVADADAQGGRVSSRAALWAENKFAESEYIDTAKVTVFTDNLDVRAVNHGTFTSTHSTELATLFDAGVVVTSGVTTVSGNATIAYNSHDAALEVSGSAELKFNNRIWFGYYNASGGRVSVSDNAKFTVNDFVNFGQHTAGICLFTQNGGTVTGAADFNIGVGNAGGLSRYEMTGGTLTVGGNLRPAIGESNGIAHGEFMQGGGTVNANGNFYIGQNVSGTEGAYVMTNGVLNIPNNVAHVAQTTGVTGLLDIAGGTATATKGILIAAADGANGTLRLRDAGQLSALTIYRGHASGNATVAFDGGTLTALADKATFISGITNVVFNAGGVTLDTAGHNLAVTNCALYATPGSTAIRLTGGGALDFTDTTLDFTDEVTEGFVFAQATGAGTFTGVPSLAEGLRGCKIRLSADGKTVKVFKSGFILLVR